MKKRKKMTITTTRPIDTRNTDVTLCLSRLQASINPPNEDEESIKRRINAPPGTEFIFIDEVGGTICRLVAHDPLGREPACIVAWLLWDGTGDRMRLLTILREALESFFAYYPKSGLWPAYGDLPTLEEAQAIQQLVGKDIVTLERSPINPIYTRITSTIAATIARLQIVSPPPLPI